MTDQKEVVREATRGYLLERHPECINEFEAVFDSVCNTLQGHDADTERTGSTADGEGPSFDGSVGESAVVATACVVGYTFLKAALKDIAKRDLPKVLDKLEAELSKSTGRPELVSAIRQRVEGILQAM